MKLIISFVFIFLCHLLKALFFAFIEFDYFWYYRVSRHHDRKQAYSFWQPTRSREVNRRIEIFSLRAVHVQSSCLNLILLKVEFVYRGGSKVSCLLKYLSSKVIYIDVSMSSRTQSLCYIAFRLHAIVHWKWLIIVTA